MTMTAKHPNHDPGQHSRTSLVDSILSADQEEPASTGEEPVTVAAAALLIALFVVVLLVPLVSLARSSTPTVPTQLDTAASPADAKLDD